MKGSLRVAWFLVTALSLLAGTAWGRPLAAAPRLQEMPPDSAEISGPVRVTLALTPPVATPREARTVTVTLTNERAETVAPDLSLYFPSGMAHRAPRFPSGTSFNYQENLLAWQPVLGAGEEKSLTLPFNVVADLTHPEQTIRAELRAGGETATAALAFWTGLPPAVSVNSQPGIVAVGQPVQLIAQISGPGPFTQSWALGDGRHVVARDPAVVYGEPGRYEVRVQVANPLGTATANATITVVARPAAAFGVDDALAEVGQAVRFSNASGGQPPLSYWWEFGDGQTSTERDPAHAFTAPGSYEVRLLVQSEHGQSVSSQTVTVGNAPTADMMVAESGATGAPLHAQAYTDGSADSVRWEMGDGRHYEGETVSHTYRRPGEYLVTMTATNEFGETRVSRPVQVAVGTLYVYLPQMIGTGRAVVDNADGGSGTLVTVPDAPETAQPLPPPPANQGGAGAPLVEGEPGAGEAYPAPEGEPATAPEEAPPLPPAPQPAPQPTAPLETEAPPPPRETQPAPPPELIDAVALPPQAPLRADASPAEQLLWYINEARRLHGLSALAYNYELSIAAQLHTVDMAGHPEIMHDGSDGSRPAERQRRHGYLGAYGGEAVAWGWESAIPVVEFWVNSPPHRALILNPEANEVGVGHTADGTAPNLWYWAAEFGVRP